MGGLRRGGAEVDGGDLPEDMQIGFSGKGAGAFGSFATPARSSRPTSQVGHATSSNLLSSRESPPQAKNQTSRDTGSDSNLGSWL